MSVIVSYKGAALTTVSNETKTLDTQGTWMEDDLTLTDTTTRVATLTTTVSTYPAYSISFSVDGEPTNLAFMRMGESSFRRTFTQGVISGVFDGNTCTLNRAFLMTVTSSGTTTTNIVQSLLDGTYDYTNGTVTITSSTYFPIGTYTIIYSYEP